jgi:hypothetical protein
MKTATGWVLRSPGRDGMKKAAYLGSILFVVLPACSDSQQTVVSPTPPTTPPATISILSSNGQGNLGAQSFSPNPSSQSQVASHGSTLIAQSITSYRMTACSTLATSHLAQPAPRKCLAEAAACGTTARSIRLWLGLSRAIGTGERTTSGRRSSIKAVCPTPTAGSGWD